MSINKKKTKSRRPYHHGNLKSALKKAALKLVREKGPRGFSLNEASRLAGVTVGAPYRHFRDKDALLAEITCDGNAILEREMRKANDAAGLPKERMLEMGMAYLRFAFDHPDYFAVIFGSGIDKSQHPDVQISAAKTFGVVQAAAAEMESSLALAQERAVSSWALVHGLATLSAEGALATGAKQSQDLEIFRAILQRSIWQEY